MPDSLNPVEWWHGLEGGTIAETRPPPPNADAPYPNLGSVPAKPPAPDSAAQQRVASGLIADRANAQYAATSEPIPQLPPPPQRPAPSPAPAGGGEEQPNASLQAANAPPRPPQRAPLGAVSAAALPAPAGQAAPAAPMSQPAPAAAPAPAPSAPPSAPAAPAPAAAAPKPAPAAPVASAAAAMPAMPAAPPPPPAIPGVNVPAVTAPTPAPVAPPPGPAKPPAPGAPVAIRFPPGSAVLPEDAFATLQSLAKSRGSRNIAVTGFGEAAATDPAAQAAALPLGLDRARAVAGYLAHLGVPPTSVRVDASPAGGGAVARLVN